MDLSKPSGVLTRLLKKASAGYTQEWADLPKAPPNYSLNNERQQRSIAVGNKALSEVTKAYNAGVKSNSPTAPLFKAQPSPGSNSEFQGIKPLELFAPQYGIARPPRNVSQPESAKAQETDPANA